jgi:hypothetical protein
MVRTLSSAHQLPANPQWIEFTRSDGSLDRQPTNTTPIVDENGQVNFMKPIALDEGFAIGWRIAWGKALAAKLNYPGKLRSFLLTPDFSKP